MHVSLSQMVRLRSVAIVYDAVVNHSNRWNCDDMIEFDKSFEFTVNMWSKMGVLILLFGAMALAHPEGNTHPCFIPSDNLKEFFLGYLPFSSVSFCKDYVRTRHPHAYRRHQSTVAEI